MTMQHPPPAEAQNQMDAAVRLITQRAVDAAMREVNAVLGGVIAGGRIDPHAQHLLPGGDGLTAASTITIPTNVHYVHVGGSTGIEHIAAPTPAYVGYILVLVIEDGLTFTQGADLMLLGGTDYDAPAWTSIMLTYDGSGVWREQFRSATGGGGGGGGGDFGTPNLTLGTTNSIGSSGYYLQTNATVATFDATAPAASAPGDTGAVGSAAKAARRDHEHPREGFGSPVASAVGDAGTDGTADTISHSDHVHEREAFGSPAASAPDDTGADGVATTVARSDHEHAREGFGAPGDSAVGDAADEGGSPHVARQDHQHGREAFGSPAASAPGDASGNGIAATVARSDHHHAREAFGTPAVVLSTAAAAGSSGELLQSDAHIIAFDTTAPTGITFGGSSAVGSAAVAARRDHGHSAPAMAVMLDGGNLASAATISPVNGYAYHITGTTTISQLQTQAAGGLVLLTFDGAVTLTHNGTSLILQSAVNYTTVAGDSFLFKSEGTGNWREVGRWQKTPFAAPSDLDADGSATGTAATTSRSDHKHDVKLGTKNVDHATVPTDQQVLMYIASAGKWQASTPPFRGGGVTSDLPNLTTTHAEDATPTVALSNLHTSFTTSVA